MVKKLKDLLLEVLVIALLISIIYFNVTVSVPRDMFLWQGYCIDGDVEFTRVNNHWWEANTYRSSAPIMMADGTACELWQVRSWGQTVYSYYVEPVIVNEISDDVF